MSADTPSGPGPRRRRTRRALYASLGVGVVVSVLVAVLATRSSAPGAVVYTPLGGKAAPPIAGRALVGGEPVSLAALRGKYVLVDFFAGWCVPCQEEVPQIEKFLFEHRSAHDIAALGVDIDENAGDGRAFLEQYGVTWPAIEDPSGARSVSLAYGIGDPPESYLVRPDGRVVAAVVGGVTTATLDRLLSVATREVGVSAALPLRPVRSSRRPRVLASRWSWALLAAVVVVALAVGSVHPAPATRAARITYLESIIKCPVCEDVSIAGSNAQQALNLRAKVVALVDAGRSDAQVEQYVVGQFGTDELLRPTNPVIWIVPIVAIVVAAAGLATALVRRRARPVALGAGSADEALVAAALGSRSGEEDRA